MRILKDTVRPELARIKRELEALKGLSVHIGIMGDSENDLLMIARVHEYGATINAKNVKHLAIPLTDEAETLVSRAAGYFLHAGYDDFLRLGIAVVEVGQTQDRTVLLVDEAARRVGFDVRIRYTRQDTRLVSTVEETRIIQNKNRSD